MPSGGAHCAHETVPDAKPALQRLLTKKRWSGANAANAARRCIVIDFPAFLANTV